ncbi:MAG: hypothetical protein KBC42_03515 [Candidatus Pacebacteria bacterium]|nr:hypothetical protein [Candidatus Paceibacterota bacterium]MBP9780964.1 hypothetical protein [Candidatus Paceibacterota bacterium]
METDFIKMEVSVQEKLEYFREIFGQPEYNSDIDIIGLRYTIPQKDDPYEEKIRNVRVSLSGSWKIVYLTEIYGVEESNNAFERIAKQSYVVNYGLCLRSLYDHPKAHDFSVKARNFEDGVNALFEMAIMEYPSDKDLLEFRLKGITNYKSFPILIRRILYPPLDHHSAFTWSGGILSPIETKFRPVCSLGK